MNLVQHGLIQNLRTAEIAAALLRHPGGQMARAGLPMLRFATGSEAESLFGTLVGFHLRHSGTWQLQFRENSYFINFAAHAEGEETHRKARNPNDESRN